MAGTGGTSQVDAAVSATYRWNECGRIEPSAVPIDAAYAADGSVIVLEETGRVRLFPEGSSIATTLLSAAADRGGISVAGDGLSLVSHESGAALWYAAADGQPIGASTSALVPTDPPVHTVPPADAAAESCAGWMFVTNAGMVVTGGAGTVCFWQSPTGPLLSRFAEPTTRGRLRPASGVSDDGYFTLDGDELVHVGLDGQVVRRIDLAGLFATADEQSWDVVFDRLTRSFLFAFYSGSASRIVSLDVLSGNARWEVDLGDPELLPSFRFEPEGKLILVKGGPILRLDDGEIVGHDVPALPGELVALTAGARRQLRLGEQVADWDLEQQRMRGLYGSHTQPIRDIDVSADGRHFATHGDWAVAWEVAPQFSQSRPLFHGAAPDESWYAALEPSGSMMVVSGDNVRFSTPEGLVGWPPPATVCTSSARWEFSPNGAWAAGSLYSREVQVYDAHTLELVTALPTSNCGGAVAFSPDGSKLVTASLEVFETGGWTRLWGPPAGSKPWNGHTGAERGVTFSPDGQELVATADCSLHNQDCRSARFRTSDGSAIADVPELQGERVRYSPEGHWLVSKARLLHVPTGTALTYAEGVEVAAFTPEGDLVTGSRDGSITRYCRAPTGE